jgi:XRE family transcriptional regulator, regulator of sulfur utilization
MNMADHTSTMLAANLRRLRERRKLTQQDLAERSGVPRPTLAHLESGEANPTLSVLVRVAEALATSIEELIGRVDAAVTIHSAKSLTETRRGRARRVDLAPGAFAGLSFQRVELPAGARVDTAPEARTGRCFVALEAGELTLEVAGETHRLNRGDVAAILREVGHRCSNSGKSHVVLYSVTEGSAAG